MPTTLFRNVAVYPGFGDALVPSQDVTIDGATISDITPHDPAGSHGDDMTVIDGDGHTLMPGLIDAHWHAAFTSVTPFEALIADPYYLLIVAGQQATATMMRGSRRCVTAAAQRSA